MRTAAVTTALAATLAFVAPAIATAAPPQDSNRARGGISANEAIAIARSHGVVRVTDVDRDDGRWEVEGRNRRGRELEVHINIRNGRVIWIDRD